MVRLLRLLTPNSLRPTTQNDAPSILAMAEENRGEHHRYQMTVWRRAGESSAQQTTFLTSLLTNESVIAFVHETDSDVDGFVFASVPPAPPVYNPGGPVAGVTRSGLFRATSATAVPTTAHFSRMCRCGMALFV